MATESSKDAAVTREHKLALIVGFSLVLVLGVLLSDHLSKARSEVQSQDIQLAVDKTVGARQEGLTLVDRVPGDDLRAPLPGVTTPTQAVTPPAPLPQAGDSNIVRPQGSPEVIVEAVPDGGFRRSEIPPGLAGKVDTVPMGNVSPLPTMSMSNGATAQGTPIDTPSTTSMLPPSKGQMKRHEIKEGDAMYAIARNMYGDGTLWPKLREFNKGKISDSGSVREGVTIMLPPKDVLLGQASLAPEAKVNPTTFTNPSATTATRTPTTIDMTNPRAGATADKKTGSASYTTYTIKSGDSLQDVAKRLLGTSKRWPEIVEANKGIDPTALKVGQQVRIPAR
jgi:nucleoid-associated protein YgaU